MVCYTNETKWVWLFIYVRIERLLKAFVSALCHSVIPVITLDINKT